MIETLTLRAITPADEAEWRRLWTGYLAYYETVLPDEVYAVTFARLLAQAPGGFRGLLAVAVVALMRRFCGYLKHISSAICPAAPAHEPCTSPAHGS